MDSSGPLMLPTGRSTWHSRTWCPYWRGSKAKRVGALVLSGSWNSGFHAFLAQWQLRLKERIRHLQTACSPESEWHKLAGQQRHREFRHIPKAVMSVHLTVLRRCQSRRSSMRVWVAVSELNLSYYIGEIPLITLMAAAVRKSWGEAREDVKT